MAGNGPQGDLGRYAAGAMKNLAPAAADPSAPALLFKDASGKPLDLTRFRGKVVVVNLWATWCSQCVTEMPTLAELQKRYEKSDLVVIPISEDKPDNYADAKSFIDVHRPLPLYFDRDTLAIAARLKILGIPATIIYDRQGREVARLKGDANWMSPEAIALFNHLLKAG